MRSNIIKYNIYRGQINEYVMAKRHLKSKNINSNFISERLSTKDSNNENESFDSSQYTNKMFLPNLPNNYMSSSRQCNSNINNINFNNYDSNPKLNYYHPSGKSYNLNVQDNIHFFGLNNGNNFTKVNHKSAFFTSNMKNINNKNNNLHHNYFSKNLLLCDEKLFSNNNQNNNYPPPKEKVDPAKKKSCTTQKAKKLFTVPNPEKNKEIYLEDVIFS